MSKVRVCFLGTPEFAVTSLKALLEDEHFEVVGVVTQPDRPAGRKLQLTPSPVKVLAQHHQLKVLCPESLRSNPLMVDAIRTWSAEIAVVVAFGQILTEDFMRIFNFGAVNVHASVLPRWRGAAPIQRALEAGDKESGVTLQRMVKKLDAGDILGIRKVQIPLEMDAHKLHDELAFLGADLLRVEMMDYIRGHLGGIPQDESQVTYAKKIEKAEGEISWALSALEIHNKIRALTLGPGTHSNLEGKKIKIHRSLPIEMNSSSSKSSEISLGQVIEIRENSFFVQCGSGRLEIFEVQPESRNRLSAHDFIRGQNLQVGDQFR